MGSSAGYFFFNFPTIFCPSSVVYVKVINKFINQVSLGVVSTYIAANARRLLEASESRWQHNYFAKLLLLDTEKSISIRREINDLSAALYRERFYVFARNTYNIR